MTEPACDCPQPDGAHDERCAWVRWLRSPAYEPGDLTPPLHLRRSAIRQSVFSEDMRESVFD